MPVGRAGEPFGTRSVLHSPFYFFVCDLHFHGSFYPRSQKSRGVFQGVWEV